MSAFTLDEEPWFLELDANSHVIEINFFSLATLVQAILHPANRRSNYACALQRQFETLRIKVGSKIFQDILSVTGVLTICNWSEDSLT